MKQSKGSSIKKRMRKFISGTVLFLVLMGCSVTILIFFNFFRIEKTKQMEAIMNNLYDHVVMDTQEKVKTQVESLSKVIAEKHSNTNVTEFSEDSFKRMFSDIQFAVYNDKYELLFSTSGDVLYDYEDSVLLYEQDSIFLGNVESGIRYYEKEPILGQSNELLGYVIAYKGVTLQKYIDHIKSMFHVDATIFYKDLRVVTTLIRDDTMIVGTKLDKKHATWMLAEPTVSSKIAYIFGETYITSYRSFGNPGETPIGIVSVGESLSRYSTTLLVVFFAILSLGIFLYVTSVRFSDRWLERNIVKPMRSTTELIAKITDGTDITSTIIEENDSYNEFEHILEFFKTLINSLKESKKETERIAYYDNLTGLPNRFHLFRKNATAEENQVSSLILFDLDDLKTINNLYGPKIGDLLIQEIGLFVSFHLRTEIKFKVYRMGGATFALLTEGSIGEVEIRLLVEALMQRFVNPFVCNGFNIKATISSGIAMRSQTNETVEELLHHAELAMNEVKKAFKNDYMFYLPKISENLRQQKEMEEDLKRAIDRKEFHLVYQPKFNLKTKQFDSFEALLRWNSPKRGIVPPSEFIGLAEQSGLIVPIGKWVLEEACQMVKQLSSQMNFPYKIAVNISPIQINREDFFKTILEVLIKSNLDSSQLELEITENLLMTSFSTAVGKLRQLYVLGVSISVDDFGRGYSSLAYLQELPIHTLKIDKMFIDTIKAGEEAMVGDIIRLGHNMNLTIVAEGVETSQQNEYLINSGCDSIQGYYYSEPLTSKQLEVFLKQYR